MTLINHPLWFPSRKSLGSFPHSLLSTSKKTKPQLLQSLNHLNFAGKQCRALTLRHGSKSRTSSEHPNPHQNRLTCVMHLPQNGTFGFDPQPLRSHNKKRPLAPAIRALSVAPAKSLCEVDARSSNNWCLENSGAGQPELTRKPI